MSAPVRHPSLTGPIAVEEKGITQGSYSDDVKRC